MVPELPAGCRPEELCPNICDEFENIKDQGDIEANISAVEQYVAALGKKLIHDLNAQKLLNELNKRLDHEVELAEQKELNENNASQKIQKAFRKSREKKRRINAAKTIQKAFRAKKAKPALEAAVGLDVSVGSLNANVLKNLEKVAAKDFQPNFIKDKGKQESFKSFIEHAKGRTEKYNLEKKATGTTETFVAERIEQKNTKEPDHYKTEYTERVKARIAVYAGWEYKDLEKEDSFMLVNSGKDQEITVTKREDGSFSIKATKKPVSDETIGIMIELAHNVLRFSADKNMRMNVKGVESSEETANKFKQGLEIINKDKKEPEKLKYTISCKSSRLPDK